MIERILISAMFSHGCKIGFFRGDILKLFVDINELRPTIFPSVPRLLSRLYDKIKAGVELSSPVKKMIFNFSYSRKLALLNVPFFLNFKFCFFRYRLVLFVKILFGMHWFSRRFKLNLEVHKNDPKTFNIKIRLYSYDHHWSRSYRY